MRLEMVALSQISRAPCVPKWQVCTIGVATATQLASGRAREHSPDLTTHRGALVDTCMTLWAAKLERDIFSTRHGLVCPSAPQYQSWNYLLGTRGLK